MGDYVKIELETRKVRLGQLNVGLLRLRLELGQLRLGLVFGQPRLGLEFMGK